MALIAAASTACEPGKLGTAAKVERAFDKLGKQKSYSAEMSFDADAEKIYGALKDTDDFDRDDADVLAGMKYSFSAAYDKPLKDVTDKDDKSAKVAYKVNRAGKQLVEVRSTDGKSYVRSDLKEVVSLVQSSGRGGRASGPGSTPGAALDEMMKKADQLPASMGAVKSALKGEWVVLDNAAAEEFAKSQGSDSAGGPNPFSPDGKSQKRFLDAFRKALGDNAQFKDAGKKNGVDHVLVTVPAKKVAEDVKEGLKPLKDKLNPFGKQDKAADDDLEDFPDKVTVDVAIKNGTLTGLTVDAAQFDKKAKGELPLTITLKAGDTAAVEAPAGAKELKPQDLLGALMTMGGDRLGDEDGSGRHVRPEKSGFEGI
ncbi:hypothetical protein [Streptomyces griseocarneus]|uniref:hypothetical protein n=1 Tax=Streptomyces griseocarneus TaxID=51201 RepID=UPI00167E60F7|nr:hypothetical protein [Streptomyces griseocarneus]MBZ6477380.1 hypothetical protein [Streptomyces griseocarneus]GHG75888.1 hypothetical protein GCM10018779_53670 [Streptomyces griseocarneus]